MPIHELIKLLMSGGAYFDRVNEGEGGNTRTTTTDDEDDDLDEDDPDLTAPADAAKKLREFQKYAKRLRTEAANKRAENKRLKEEKAAAEQALKDANKKHEADILKLNTDHKTATEAAVAAALADVTTKSKAEKVNDALKAEATKAGVKDVDDLLKIVDASGITFDDKGAVVGVEKLIADTKTAKPHLFGTVTTTSTQKTPDPAAVTGKKASEMTDEEYAAAKGAYIKTPARR